MDPQLAQGMPEMHILRDMFVGLVDEDAGAHLIPGVAEKWDVSADGKTWTFHLRDNNWSDGTPVTAHDFVYAWQRGVDPAVGSKYSFFLYPIKNAKEITEGKQNPDTLGVSAPDDKTLVVELNNPTPYFAGLLTNAVTYPVPKHIVEKHGKDWTRACNPRYILLDEPFAGVDPIAVGDIRNIITHLTDRGIGVLITDHNVRETLKSCDRAYILSDGAIIAEGSPAEIVAHEEARRVYLGEDFTLN